MTPSWEDIFFFLACTIASHGGEFSASVQIWQSAGIKRWVYEGQTNLLAINLIIIIVLLKLWYQYDSDCSGFIEADELKVKFYIIMLYFFLKIRNCRTFYVIFWGKPEKAKRLQKINWLSTQTLWLVVNL